MAKEDVKILGRWPSPFVMRPRFALNLKSVEYEFLEETFGSKSELLLKSNPVHKKVPVLIHRGKPICESMIIVEYIDEVWSSGASILPSDPFDRATARFWGAYVDEKFFPILRRFIAVQDEEAVKTAMEQLAESLQLLEDAHAKLCSGGPFFGGNHIGYVDIALGGCVVWMWAVSKIEGLDILDRSRFPGLVKWAETFSSDPAVKDVIPDTDKLAEFIESLREKMKAAETPK